MGGLPLDTREDVGPDFLGIFIATCHVVLMLMATCHIVATRHILTAAMMDSSWRPKLVKNGQFQNVISL